MEKYNTKVRQAISDEYIKCSKNRAEAMREYEEIAIRLANEMDKLTHTQYMALQDRANYLRREMEELSIRIDTWDKAREICLNIADEVL